VWDVAAIKSKVSNIEGTDANDTLYGFGDGYSNTSEVFKGYAGDDKIYGYSGNDTIDGGTGNDSLYGGSGNDTYIFGLGDGVDTIADNDSSTGNIDVLSFKEGIALADVKVNRVGNNLELSIKNTTDKVVVKDYFSPYYAGTGSYDSSNNVNKVEQIKFADGTVWDVATIKSKVSNIEGTDANDTLYGFDDGYSNTSEVFKGYAGDDKIYGYSGNDTIDGGTGNDSLYGGSGNDTYIFYLDHGQDVISDYDTTTGNIDTIDLQANPLELIFQRSSNNLVLSQAEAPDQITIQSWYSGSAYQIEQIKAADGSMLLNTQIEQLIQAMASFSQDTGMEWEQAIQDNQEAVSNILAQFWTTQA